mmetsp:Transcript_35359/g.69782  ORF Transcript_35359/g.69782 Transcript_35359/m.69782 type:complete len:235 (-) Transcript_35359:748-1452(-)
MNSCTLSFVLLPVTSVNLCCLALEGQPLFFWKDSLFSFLLVSISLSSFHHGSLFLFLFLFRLTPFLSSRYYARTTQQRNHRRTNSAYIQNRHKQASKQYAWRERNKEGKKAKQGKKERKKEGKRGRTEGSQSKKKRKTYPSFLTPSPSLSSAIHTTQNPLTHPIRYKRSHGLPFRSFHDRRNRQSCCSQSWPPRTVRTAVLPCRSQSSGCCFQQSSHEDCRPVRLRLQCRCRRW